MPITFYGISAASGNNYLYLSVNYNTINPADVPGSVYDLSRVIIVPDGNYNAADLIQSINLSLRPINSDNTYIYPDVIFSYIQLKLDISITGSGSGKVTILPDATNASNNYAININSITLDFTLGKNGLVDGVNIASKLGWNLGFQKRQYMNSKRYTGETIIEPSNTRYIYLVVDDYNNSVNNHFITVFNQSILNPNILARISLKGNYFSSFMENDFNLVTEPRKYFGPVDIQRLQVKLYDDTGRLLNMNYSDYSFCLRLEILYDL
jgi:hypothetical protein